MVLPRPPPTEGFRPPTAARSAAQDAAEVKLYGLRERDFFASLESAARCDLMDVMSLTCLRKAQAASDRRDDVDLRLPLS